MLVISAMPIYGGRQQKILFFVFKNFHICA